MKLVHKLLAGGMCLLLIAAIFGIWRTGEARRTLLIHSAGPAAKSSAVDQTPMLTAEKLVRMPTTSDEVAPAQEALRIADQQMDLAYAAAEREMEDHPPTLSPEAKHIEARLKQAEDAVQADNTLVERLKAEVDKASGSHKDQLTDQLTLATAHQEEHQDEVDDAKDDLARAGGDVQTRIAALMEEHKTSSEVVDKLEVKANEPPEKPGLAHYVSHWWLLHQKQLALWQAKQEAEVAAAKLSEQHNALAGQVESQKQNATPATGVPAKLSSEQSASLVQAAKSRAGTSKRLSSLDKQIENQQQLAGNYAEWIGVVAGLQRAVLHRVLIGVVIILAIGIVALFFDGLLERLLLRLRQDRRRMATLRTVTRVFVQVLAVLLILLVIFGPPTQLGTFIGLATAGLTVALKDFIVGFLGWLVLMGKNGIRLGDWVEINGVTGEVVELGMFHTVLLETGNWTDSGHPTGRRVTFTNSFAIEGHYFNFSTSGQWLWDELSLVLPSGQDPYPIIDAVQKKVKEATAESAHEAEEEWRRVTRSHDMSAMTAAPAINVKPVAGGIEVVVRYITRASERYRLRSQLYQAAVELLGQKAPPQRVAETTSRLA